METVKSLHKRVEVLEKHTEALERRTYLIIRRVLVFSSLTLGLLIMALPSSMALVLGAASAHGSSFFEIPDSQGLEFSGAAATDLNNLILLVGDDSTRTLFLHQLGPISNETLAPSSSDVRRLVFAFDGNTEIDNLEGLTRRPSDGKYFMTAGMSRFKKNCEQSRTRAQRFGSFKLVPLGTQLSVVELAVREGLRDDVMRFLQADITLPASVKAAAQWNPPQLGGLNI